MITLNVTLDGILGTLSRMMSNDRVERPTTTAIARRRARNPLPGRRSHDASRSAKRVVRRHRFSLLLHFCAATWLRREYRRFRWREARPHRGNRPKNGED